MYKEIDVPSLSLFLIPSPSSLPLPLVPPLPFPPPPSPFYCNISRMYQLGSHLGPIFNILNAQFGFCAQGKNA